MNPSRLLLAVLFPWLSLALAQEFNFPTTVADVPAAALTVYKRVDEVNLVLSATNRRGHFVRDLNPRDLVISDNGEPPDKVTYFQTQTDLPLRVALVIDSSDSVKYRFDFELKSAQGFLKRVLRPQDDSALVVGFNQNATLVQPLTSNLSQLARGLKSLKAQGDTALFDALALASDGLHPSAPDSSAVRRVIVLLTDGEENSSHSTLEQAIEHALRAEAAIYIVNIKNVRASKEDIEGDRIIQELATSTGGTVLQGAENEDIVAAFRKIQDELRSQYALAYRPRHLIGSYLFRPIRIFGPDGVRIRCREGYYPQ